jgi:hypothetical protein
MATDVTELVERLDVFEDRVGVSFEALFCTIDDEPDSDGEYKIELHGELHNSAGTTLDDDIEIVLSAYDTAGRVLATTTEYLTAESFFGFEVLDMSLWVPTAHILRIRLFPKRA